MNDNLIIILLGVMLLFGLAITVAAIIVEKKQKKDEFYQAHSKKDIKNHLYGLHKIYMVTPILKRYYDRLRKRYQSINPTDAITINTWATNKMTASLGVMLLIIIITAVICKCSISYMIVGITGAYIIFTMMINSAYENLEMKLMEQTADLITEIHANYHDTKDVEESLAKCQHGLPAMITLHAKRILNILESTDSSYELEQYAKITPNRYLLLLATICQSICEYGDMALEDGRSLFLSNLIRLKTEVNDERILLTKRANAFAGKTVGVLIPLFILKPLEAMLSTALPELSTFYAGVGGLISLVAISLVCLVCYEAINSLRSPERNKDESVTLKRIVDGISPIRNLLTMMVNKNYSKALRTMDMLKTSGEKDSINVFYLKRILFGIAMSVITLFVVIAGNQRAKATAMVSGWSGAYSDELMSSAYYQQQMEEVSEVVGKTYTPNMDISQAVYSYINENGLEDDIADSVITHLTLRTEQYASIYFKWWELILVILAYFIGYQVPYLLLCFNAKNLLSRRDDEIAHFRTVILILMHEERVMTEDLLRWMQRFAVTYKSSLTKCVLNYSDEQEEAIKRMSEEEGGYAPFRRLCHSLCQVDTVGAENAFDDLEAECEYYKEERKEKDETLLEKNKSKSSIIMMIPIYMALFLYIVFPFVLYIVNMASELVSVFS